MLPAVYHMAEEGAWEGIQRHGLLSTTALLDLFDVVAERREALEARRRLTSVALEDPQVGTAVLRDQKPLSESKLESSLTDDTTVREWLLLLNSKTFFWSSQARVENLRAAREYRKRGHIVLTVDTEELVRRHGDRLWLTVMNTGTTSPIAHPRSRNSFKPLREFDYEASRKKRGRRNAIKELAVDYGVPDIVDFTLRVERTEPGGERESEVLYEDAQRLSDLGIPTTI